MRSLLIGYLFFFGNIGFSQNIMRYEMASNHWLPDLYTQQYNRSFDSLGIITQKGEYHPLTICLYGIQCYDKFLETKDEYYLTQFKNQYKYFEDTSKFVVLFDGKGIGLPYRFNFHDLKPLWYSGLTQGTTVSFLLRYADYFKDEHAFELAEKVGFLLKVPEEDGGVLSRTPEGFLWIEEYPNSKKSRNVLNGFISGLVGLKEYCDFFPDDTLASHIHDSVYFAMKQVISKYDYARNWAAYDRNNKSIPIYYLRLQIGQFDHLYSIYKDPFFRDQMHIWSRMLVGKVDHELKFYKNMNYNFGISFPAIREQDDYDISYKKKFDSLILVNSNVVVKNNRSKQLNYSSEYKAKKSLKIVPYHSLYIITLDVNKGKENSYLKFYFSDGTEVNAEFNKHLAYQTFSFEKEFDSVQIFKKGLNKKIHVKKISFYDYRTYRLPMYASYDLQGSYELKADSTYRIKCDHVGTEGALVFFRYSNNKETVKDAKWTHYNHFLLNQGFLSPEESGVYEFFISVPIHSDAILLRNVNVVNEE